MNSALVMFGDDLRQRGLAGARRSPEDDRAGIVALNRNAQRLARPDQVILPDKLIQRARTHAIRQRPRCVGRPCIRNGLKEAHITRDQPQLNALG